MSSNTSNLALVTVGAVVGAFAAVPVALWLIDSRQSDAPPQQIGQSVSPGADAAALQNNEQRLAGIERKIDDLLHLQRQASTRFDEKHAVLRASLARLEDQQMQLATTQFGLEPPAVSENSQSTAKPPELDDAALEEDFRMRQQQRFDDLDNRLAMESVDVFWRDDAVELINKVAGVDKAGSLTIDNLECRSSLCRLDIQHDGGPSVNNFIDGLVAQWPWDSRTEIMTEQLGNGLVVSTIFISREEPEPES